MKTKSKTVAGAVSHTGQAVAALATTGHQGAHAVAPVVAAQKTTKGTFRIEKYVKAQQKLIGQKHNELAEYLGKRGYVLGMTSDDGVIHKLAIFDKLTNTMVPDSTELVEAFEGKELTAEEIVGIATERLIEAKVIDASKVDKLVSDIRQLIQSDHQTLWELGDALNMLADAYQKIHRQTLTLAERGKLLAVKVSPQRLSQIAVTAAFFPPNLRNLSIDFWSYEVGRKAGAPEKTAEEIAKVIEASEDADAVKAALTEGDDDTDTVHELRIVVKIVEGAEGPESAKITYDGGQLKPGAPWVQIAQGAARGLLG